MVVTKLFLVHGISEREFLRKKSTTEHTATYYLGLVSYCTF